MTDLFLVHTGTVGAYDHYEVYDVEDRHRMEKCLAKVAMNWWRETETLEDKLKGDYMVVTDTWDPAEPYPDEPGPIPESLKGLLPTSGVKNHGTG